MRLRFVLGSILAALSTAKETVSLPDAVTKLRGDDDRLVPYDVTEYTAEQQEKLCPDVIPAAVKDFETSPGSTTALEALILCITNNPENRQTFANAGLHKAIIGQMEKSLKSKDYKSVAVIGQLVWISVFGNKDNHDGFAKAGAVKALSKVFFDDKASPVAKMWSAVALQNLAASFCKDDSDDPCCYWEWPGDGSKYVEIDPRESGELFIDSTKTREEIFNTKGLVDKLMELSCAGPVQGEESESNPFPSGAKRGLDDDHPNIVAWAATGALQNLALYPKANDYLQKHALCFCQLSFSNDPLEGDKANLAIHFIRGEDPCWWYGRQAKPDLSRPKTIPLCVDGKFLDKDNQTCDVFGEGTTDEDCAAIDLATKKPASELCCGCQGGEKVNGWELKAFVASLVNPDDFYYEDEL